jgi:ribonuclease HI
VTAIEKLHAMAAEAARLDDGGKDPSTFGTKALAKVPKVQPSEADGGPVKTIQVSADSSQTTRIAGNLGEK